MNTEKGQPLELFFIDGKPDGMLTAVVNGRPANGTIEWKLASGKTYKKWDADKLAQEGLYDKQCCFYIQYFVLPLPGKPSY